MTLKIRRIIYASFIILFLIVAPALIFYASGYRYNLAKKRIEMTGVFYIKSYPRHVSVYLNDKLYADKTPAQISHLLANNYQIKIVKDGYFIWSKTLPVYPKSTTFAEDITLFKNSLKFEPLLLANYQKLEVSPDLNKVILLEQNNGKNILHLYNLQNDKKAIVYQSPDKLKIDSWCQTSNKVIVQKNLDYLIINAESQNTSSVKDLFGRIYEQVKCDYYNDNILYGLWNNNLYQLDLLTKKSSLIINEPLIAYLPWKTKLIYLANAKDKQLLKSYFNNKGETLLILPKSAHYQFYSSETDKFALLDKDEAQAYLINPDIDQPLQRILKNVSFLKWYDKQLIYWNDFELSVYYPESNETILLERASNPIQNAFWHSGYVDVFGQINNMLKVYELDSRDQRNIHELTPLAELTKDNIFINKKGDTLYLLTVINQQPGFYKAEIQ